MVTRVSRFAAVLAMASLVMPTQTQAAPLPAKRGGAYLPPVMRAEAPGVPVARDHPGRWRGGWGGGWRHRDDGLSGGDVLAGLLVIGGIAAIAVAASNADKRKREEARDYPNNRNSDNRYPENRYAPPRGQDSAPSQGSGSGSIDAAVDACVAEIERGRDPVDSVDSVTKAVDGWRIEGHLGGGKPFACRVGSDGRIGSVTVDGVAPAF
jgi:hypothetical protein